MQRCSSPGWAAVCRRSPPTAGSRQVYARPFDRRDDRSRLVIIVLDIGLSRAASNAAIDKLPGAPVLAVDAYAPAPQEWIAARRRGGHEVVAAIPPQASAAAAPMRGGGALAVAADAADSGSRLRVDPRPPQRLASAC
ncbi:MAG: divergent polysaccharide deacetylase family protein [Rhodospirillales bacterium]|nr:divergent polysaccharide deacetylase family protein [Rhodospirillales bacterium]